jgi:hypothetical protein
MVRNAIRLGVAIVFVTCTGAAAQVPKPEDMKSCNEKAKSELSTASASPRLEPEAKGGLNAGTPPIDPHGSSPRPAESGKPPATSVAAEEKDPQLQGIDPEGARDPAYVAAYKTCMRQAGF